MIQSNFFTFLVGTLGGTLPQPGLPHVADTIIVIFFFYTIIK